MQQKQRDGVSVFCYFTGVDGDGEALHGGDGERPEQRADADVDEDVGATDPRREIENEHRTQQQHRRQVHQETCRGEMKTCY